MSELTASQVTAVKRALAAFEDSVHEAMRAALTDTGKASFADIAGEVHDLGDESVAEELTALSSTLAERHGRELLEIERARVRIADGEIGVCADCGGDIGVERLIANPVAERCVACETVHERTRAHTATPRL